jgi:hypothetical protein
MLCNGMIRIIECIGQWIAKHGISFEEAATVFGQIVCSFRFVPFKAHDCL